METVTFQRAVCGSSSISMPCMETVWFPHAVHQRANRSKHDVINSACMHEVPKGVVVACFTGHDHKGGYELDAHGIHHVTLQSPLEAPLHGVAYGTAHFFPNRIELEGLLQTIIVCFENDFSPVVVNCKFNSTEVSSKNK